MDGNHFIVDLIVIGLVIYATSLHELAHAWVATWRGDPTPARYGRLTWNPIPHLNPIYTAVLLPVIMYISSRSLFILAQTPINPSKFKRPLQDHALVAAAGPATNFLITGILLLVMRIPGVYGYFSSGQIPFTAIVLPIATYWIFIMGLFNLMPIPPLDGYWIVRAVLPFDLRRKGDELARSQLSLIIVLIVGSLLFRYIQKPAGEFYSDYLMPRAHLLD